MESRGRQTRTDNPSRREWTIEDFGGVGTATAADAANNDAALIAFRAACAAVRDDSREQWFVLKLQSGKFYGYKNYLCFVGIDGLWFQGNGAWLVNLNTRADLAANTAVGKQLEMQVPLRIGGLGQSFMPSPQEIAVGLDVDYILWYIFYRIKDAAAGDTQVVCMTPADAANVKAGETVYVGCDAGYPGGGPQAHKRFEYPRAIADGIASTGVILLDRPLVNNYDSTLPTVFGSGNAPSAACIQRFHKDHWDVRQRYSSLNVIPPDLGLHYYPIYISGRQVEIDGWNGPGFVFTEMEHASITNFETHPDTHENTEPVDKAVAQAIIQNGTLRGAAIAGDGSGGWQHYKNVLFDAPPSKIITLHNAVYEDCRFVVPPLLNYSINLIMERCSCPDKGPIFAFDVNFVALDGTNALFENGVLKLTHDFAAHTAYFFLAQLYIGIEVFEFVSPNAPIAAGFMRGTVTSITQDSRYILIAIDWGGGQSIANGKRIGFLRRNSYHGAGNRGGIPNGDLDTLLGNDRTWLFAPKPGDSATMTQYPPMGYFKHCEVDVIRPYTGSHFPGLAAAFETVGPYYNDPARHVDLRVAGVRRFGPKESLAVSQRDAVEATGAAQIADLALFIGPQDPRSGNVTAGPVAFGNEDPADALPIVRIRAVFEWPVAPPLRKPLRKRGVAL